LRQQYPQFSIFETGKGNDTLITLPMNADDPPRRAMPTATLAGAPPGAFLKAGASAKDNPFVVGTKSISISPKQTTRGDSFGSIGPLCPGCALATRDIHDRSVNNSIKGIKLSIRLYHQTAEVSRQLPLFFILLPPFIWGRGVLKLNFCSRTGTWQWCLPKNATPIRRSFQTVLQSPEGHGFYVSLILTLSGEERLHP